MGRLGIQNATLTYCVCSNVEVIGVCGVEAETVDLHHAHHRVRTGMKWKVQTILWAKKKGIDSPYVPHFT